MTLRDDLPEGAQVAVDTAPFIYFIERGTPFDGVAADLFLGCFGSGRNSARTSVVTLAEVLVRPMRDGRNDLIDEYSSLLQESDELTLLPITAGDAIAASELRARYGLRLPDALQLAVAIQGGTRYFVTNDSNLKRVREIQVIVLAEYL